MVNDCDFLFGTIYNSREGRRISGEFQKKSTPPKKINKLSGNRVHLIDDL
jgi:hypothetical protein